MTPRRVATVALVLVVVAGAAVLAWGVRSRGWRLPGLPAGPATSLAPTGPAPGETAANALTGHGGSVTSLAFSADGSRLVSGGGRGDGTVRVWDVTSAHEAARFAGHGDSGPVIAVAFDAAGTSTISAAGPDDFSLRVWDTKTSAERQQLSGDVGLTFRALSPDARQVLAQEAGPDGRSRGFSIWELSTGRRLRTVPAPSLVATAAFSADGDTILTGGENGALTLWRTASGERLRGFAGHGASGSITHVAMASAQRLLVSAATDGTVVLWDPETGAPFRSIAQATIFALADDGRTLAVAGTGPEIRVLDAISGRERSRLSGHTARVTALAFAPGGRRLASGAQDGTIRVWTLEGGTQP